MKISISFLFFMLVSVFTSCGQNSPKMAQGFVDYNAITTSVHKANIGQIKFRQGQVSVSRIEESDFISYFEIDKNRDLNFMAFFDKSLTNYLHELDTSLSADELVKKGNYQFSFYIDDDLIYTENLNLGANTPSQKNEETILHRPLIGNENIHSWGRFLWTRFYWRNNGKAASILESGEHDLKIEIRPYLDHQEMIVGDLIAQGGIKLKLAEPKKVSEEERAIQPIKPNSDWKISNDDYDIERIRELNEKIAQNRFKDITSIVVIKNGKLLIEEYFNGADRKTLHDTRSVGKSFASTILGIAIHEKHIKSESAYLSEFYNLKSFKNYSIKKDSVTLRSLLTMSSGFLGNDEDQDSPGTEDKMHSSNNWVKFTLDLPMDTSKNVGEKWEYFTAGVNLIGDVIHKSVPNGLATYADKKLFSPMNITNYKWIQTPQDVAYMGGGLEMNALDFAKYGQLYKNGGSWKGKQIISKEWVEDTFTNYFSDSPDQTPYGYLFWNKDYVAHGKSYEAFQCSGNGGNKVIVFKDEPLVIVVTATAYNQPYYPWQVERIVEEYLLPAVLSY